MSIITVIKEVKEIHKDTIAFVKVGSFFKVYGKDAYILSYLFEYKIKEEGKIVSCGFPTQVINKVKANIEKQKVDYIVLDRKGEYEVIEQESFKDLNKYNEIFEKSKIYVNNKKRIDRIYASLDQYTKLERLKKLLKRIEDEIDEFDEGKI